MPLPVRSLTVLQNWDCQGCTACCRQYHVSVSAEEKARIEAQGWANEPDLKGVPLFKRTGGWRSRAHRLNHKPDGACVFLGPDNRCRIHVKHGSAAKPLACRIYPFSLVPAGDHWNLGLRFACPSAVEDKGRPLTEHLAEARGYAAMLEGEAGPAAVAAPPPPLHRSQQVKWADLGRITAAVSELLADEDDRVERRLRKVLFLVATLRKATFDGGGDPKKAITGSRLTELLELLCEEAEEDVPGPPEDVLPPGWVGQMVFRPVAALYVRKDTGSDRGPAQSSALGRLMSAVRFARGKGHVPQTHAAVPVTTFAAAEKPLGPLGEESEELLERWLRVKVESGQFCGPANFGMSVWDGLESLSIAFAAVEWLVRVLASEGRPIDDAVRMAVRIVDDNYGFNPLLGRGRQKYALGLLGPRLELPRLVAWYGR
jgi:lysine-N-methylase